MERIAFKMKVHKGFEQEYKRRHDAIWPELKALLLSKGIFEYSIFLEAETNALFGVFKITDTMLLDELATEPLMQRWWAFMSDIMETNADHSPVVVPLQEVFYLPG